MKRRIEKLIPLAIAVLEDVGIADKETLKAFKEFKGYISSFGASVIQSGLLPAVIFFEQEENRAEKLRHLVPEAILLLTQRKYDEKILYKKDKKLSDHIYKSAHPEELAKDISDAAVALKLALRTFNLVTN